MQCCPSRVCTAHAASGVIRDCLAAARLCRYAVSSRRLAAARLCRYSVSSRHFAADHRYRYAASAVVFRSIATVEDTAAAGRRRKFLAAHPSRN